MFWFVLANVWFVVTDGYKVKMGILGILPVTLRIYQERSPAGQIISLASSPVSKPHVTSSDSGVDGAEVAEGTGYEYGNCRSKAGRYHIQATSTSTTLPQSRKRATT
jgi:hypothetical protein